MDVELLIVIFVSHGSSVFVLYLTFAFDFLLRARRSLSIVLFEMGEEEHLFAIQMLLDEAIVILSPKVSLVIGLLGPRKLLVILRI